MCAVLCCAVLCGAVLCGAVLCCAVWCCAVPHAVQEFNPLGFWGPRKMTVILPGMDEHQRALTFAPTTVCAIRSVCTVSSHCWAQESETLLGRYKAKNMTNIVELVNKTPIWNEGACVREDVPLLMCLCRDTVVCAQLLRTCVGGVGQELPDHPPERP